MARCRGVELTELTEGATTFSVPSTHAAANEGPANAGQGFYNPAMAITRDLTVLAARAVEPPQRPDFLDGLAATGVRGLRVATEADGWNVTLNDRARETAKIAEANVDAAGLGDRVVVRRNDLNAVMAEGSWAFVEIDPYGSPVPFLSLGVRAIDDGGLLALSATDTSALHGVKPAPCRRRYLATPPRREAPGWKAAASRLLVGAVVREAARFDRAVEPVLVHHHQHAIRAYLRISDGAEAANAAVDALEEIVLCEACHGWGRTACPCGEGTPSGPYHMGQLNEPAFLAGLREARREGSLARPDAVDELLDNLEAEARMGPFYLDIDRAVKARGLGGPPARDGLRKALADRGVKTVRTHYGPTTLGYDGDPATVLEVLDEHATGS